jgi:hypothetical protein
VYKENRSAHRYNFVASAEIECYGVLRDGRVTDLCIHGCYLAMLEPFSKGSLVLVKIRTNREFFQSHGRVAHSSFGIGMGLKFEGVSPPFQLVLQEWLISALRPVEVRK